MQLRKRNNLKFTLEDLPGEKILSPMMTHLLYPAEMLRCGSHIRGGSQFLHDDLEEEIYMECRWVILQGIKNKECVG